MKSKCSITAKYTQNSKNLCSAFFVVVVAAVFEFYWFFRYGQVLPKRKSRKKTVFHFVEKKIERNLNKNDKRTVEQVSIDYSILSRGKLSLFFLAWFYNLQCLSASKSNKINCFTRKASVIRCTCYCSCTIVYVQKEKEERTLRCDVMAQSNTCHTRKVTQENENRGKTKKDKKRKEREKAVAVDQL